MVKIRLQRAGRKKKPYYHLVVQDSRRKRDGKYLDLVGFYNPLIKEEDKKQGINKEKLLFWYKKGAQATEIVQSLIKKSNINLSRK